MNGNDPRVFKGPGSIQTVTTPPPQQNIINMLNDMQLIALLASQMGDQKPGDAVTAAENILLEVVGRDMAHSTAHQQVRVDGCFKCAFLALKEHYDTAMKINSDAREKASRGE